MGGQPDRWGYGMMWWVWKEPLFPGGNAGGPMQGAFTAMGAGGQYVTVLPAENMVVAHTVDIDANGGADVSTMAYDAILTMAIMARCQSAGRC
jgi:CubicO group peptidase (beta-lactamase class C family)